VKNVRSGWPPGPDAEDRIASSVALWAVAQQDRLQLFVGPVWLPEHQVRIHKAGSWKMKKSTLICAGIDTGKSKLDMAIDGCLERCQVDNDTDGHTALAAWLHKHTVARVGIEASGGYERAIVAHLRTEGFEVVLFQPKQVRAYAMFRLQRAKNDIIDAALIAACTAAVETLHAPPDPRFAALAEHLTFIEQIEEDIARGKTRREGFQTAGLKAEIEAEIARLKKRRTFELKRLLAILRAHADLAKRLDLLISVPGIGERTALALLIRMPELGTLSREQVAALAGLAPFDDDSGKRKGSRHIGGGRDRVRKSLYAAALPAAFQWNPALVALYARLKIAGKPHKLALVACARKLLIFANTVLTRQTPWTTKKPAEII
jgi:transposase